MRAFSDVLRFELRLHFSSPLFWGVAALFFALHLLAVTRTGINLGDNEQIAINSASLVFQTHLALGLFGMLPAMAFAVTAMTRDTERRMTELFFTTPVPRAAFLLGRFSGGTLAALAIGCVGLAGAVTGPFMPWLDPERLLPFDWRPWAASLAWIVLPNLFVFCALFFSVAALTRSAGLTFGAALAVLVLDLLVNVAAVAPVPQWLLLADPIGGLAVAEASRYWTVGELNTRLPTGLLWGNRVVWLGVAFSALAATLVCYRMEPVRARLRFRRRGGRGEADLRPIGGPVAAGSRSFRKSGSGPLWSQARMDWRAVWSSPLFWIVLVMAGFAAWGEAGTLRSPLADLPLYPATAALLDAVFPSIAQFVLLAIIYYSATLVWRERDSGVDGIAGASPCPDWVPVASKALALCGVVLAILAVTTLVVLAVQEAADFHDHALGPLLEGIFDNHGFPFLMFSVLAVLVQALSPAKWSGMLLTLVVFVAVLALPLFGFEHLLYGFRIPPVVYSDLNGFGHFRPRTYTLVAYWGAFCVLLLAAGHLLFPRGYAVSFRERLREARTRLSAPLVRACAAAAIVFAVLGGVVFYNTSVLNDYVESDEVFATQARYERDYGRYRALPAPSVVDPDVRVELYPAERRLTSRGTASLHNATTAPIGEFVLTVDPRSRVEALTVDGAALVDSDPPLGFYLFRPEAPLAPGAELGVRWAFARESRGFPGVVPDTDLVGNGSYVNVGLMPAPGYCSQCELTTNRKRYGLPPAAGLPVQGGADTRLDVRLPGLDGRGSLRAVIGTEADQIAVAAGVLRRTWEEGGRRYFEYALDGPTWPDVRPLSARYAVARDEWNGVALEIYHDAKHPWNVQTMLDTAKKGLAYYSREFAPYALPYYRMAEYAGYTSRVQAGLGTVAYAERSGFLTDLRGRTALDYATLHELAHQWWGAGVYGARVQGQEVLNEGLAQYSTFMVYKAHAERAFLRGVLRWTHDLYLNARQSETAAEQPVISAEQSYVTYGKAPLALFALQELIGADKVNGALGAYYARFVNQGPPFPTALDLVAELRAAAGQEHQTLITDLFEKIVLYDVGVRRASTHAADGGYEVSLDVDATQLEADGGGAEREVPLDAWFQVAVFPESERDVEELEPLYLAHHRLTSGTQRITVRVPERPGAVGVDPYHLMIDRRRDDNVLGLAAAR